MLEHKNFFLGSEFQAIMRLLNYLEKLTKTRVNMKWEGRCPLPCPLSYTAGLVLLVHLEFMVFVNLV